MNKPNVVIGLLGPVLDQAKGPDRWDRWRPTVSLCQHDDLLVDRFELLYQRQFTKTAAAVTADIKSVSPETAVNLHLCQMDHPWDFGEVYGCLLDWARVYPFKPEEEDYLIHITTGTHVAQICLFLLAESRYLPGRLLQTSPPRRDSPQAAGAFEIIDLDLSRYDQLAARFRREQTEGLSFLKSGIETRNAAFNQLIEKIEKVAIHSAAPLMLMGPTGAGKSKLARRIYDLKKTRRQVAGDFVEVNCATIRGDGAMSALFGHKKGSFTGALTDRQGLLRAANNGVLFLDEIGELAVDEQAMLLRALEDKRFLPVGSDKEVTSDFQLIAGTNRDLISDVRGGRFRDDLFARINLWTFLLPALRERLEDIEPNLDYELEHVARKQGNKVAFNREAREAFLRFAIAGDAAWAGNFRDLNAAITRMATLAGGDRISIALVNDEISRLRQGWGDSHTQKDGLLEKLIAKDALDKLDLFDRMQLSNVVAVCQKFASLSEAGRALFAASRQAKSSANDADRLRKFLARFALTWQEIKNTAG